jgi:hypothetical protein
MTHLELIDALFAGTVGNPHNPKHRIFMQGRKPYALVALDLIRWEPDWIHISEIYALRRGGGRKALELITARADALGVTLHLYAQPLEPLYGGGKKAGILMGKRKLKAWYKQFGFKPTGPVDEMVRYPMDPRAQ